MTISHIYAVTSLQVPAAVQSRHSREMLASSSKNAINSLVVSPDESMNCYKENNS